MADIKKEPVKTEQDEKEQDLAEQEARKDAEVNTAVKFTLKLINPVQYEGREYKEFRFNFENLGGADHLNIETELNSMGIVVITPSYQTQYLMRMCARACEERVDVDLLTKLKLRDFLALRNKARNFLMSSEQ